MDSDEFGCPRCKTTKYRNPSLKLLVNTCGHSLCLTCMEMLFVKGSGPCPDCGLVLRRTGFREQLYDDPFIEKEVDIRKRLLKDYCKTEEDFTTLREYNDYLEEIEHIVFNLVKNTDVIETNKKIDQYKKENAEQIKKARSRGNPRMRELDEILEQERLLAIEREYEHTVLEKEEHLRRVKTKESLIDNLMFSDTDANSILNDYKLKLEQDTVDNKTILEAKRAEFLAAAKAQSAYKGKTNSSGPTVFSSGVAIGPTSQAAPAVPVNEELFVYEDIQYNHSAIPTLEDIITGANGLNFLSYYRQLNEAEIAGGYHISRAVHLGLLDILDPSNLTEFDPEVDGVRVSDDEDSDMESLHQTTTLMDTS